MSHSQESPKSAHVLSANETKRLKGIGHGLKPVVIIGNNGLTSGVIEEVHRALEDHELIKIKTPAGSKAQREAIGQELALTTGAIMLQHVGRVALLFKPSSKPNPKLSNLH